MPVIVSYAPKIGEFQVRYGHVFQQWIDQNPSRSINGQIIEFDEAYVINGLHSTTSRWDGNPEKHATIRLSNTELREQESWYTLHWRPNGGSELGPRPDSVAANEERRAWRNKKKARYQANKKARRDKDGEDGPEEPDAGPSQPAGTVV